MSDITDTLNNTLKQWEVEYIGKEVPESIQFCGFGELGTALGKTKHYKKGSERWSKIFINKSVSNDLTASENVLWHEFCHAWQYYNLGYSNHDIDWIKRIMKRPIYYVLYIYTCIVYLIGNRGN